MTKEEIIAAIRNCADELGRVPTVAELKEMRRINLRTIRRFFGRYADALREAGFDPHGAGYKLDLDTLFRDWAEVARRVGKLPGILEYSKQSRYSVGPTVTRKSIRQRPVTSRRLGGFFSAMDPVLSGISANQW
ncbi:MAG TPA: hypothetical protein VGK36_13220 [Candidatus Angelobacter sp.]